MSHLHRQNDSPYISQLYRLCAIPSQTLRVSYGLLMLNITLLDWGANVSHMRLDIANRLGLEIKPNSQLALLADKKTRMSYVGEVDCLVTLESMQLRLCALIMEDLQAHCFGGTTFHADNSIKQTSRKEPSTSMENS